MAALREMWPESAIQAKFSARSFMACCASAGYPLGNPIGSARTDDQGDDDAMTTEEALHAQGVRDDTLTLAEKEALDRDGYVLLPGILSPEQVDALRRRQAELLAAEGENAGKEVHQETGTDRLSDLINKGEIFHIVLQEPRVLAAVAHVLRSDFKLSSLNARNALPGQGLQGLHPDWNGPVGPDEYQVCNSLWLLDDFTPDNGATRVVPGSHRSGKTPGDEMDDPKAPHPREVVLQARAGDVVVVNSHTWHGGTTNRTNGPRRVMHGYFCRRDQAQQLDQQKYLRPETRARLSPAALHLLGVAPVPEPASVA
jgi:ectoine hydroxylase-related dioxygenase (phytanoyl-CoA dioxygenase family)